MLVITGGLVHSVSTARGEPRDIVVEGDVIADIVAPGAVRNANAEVIDASRRLIIPGLINAHTHSHGGLSKGVGDLWELDLLLNAAPWIGGSRSHEDKHPDQSRRARPPATTCSSSFRRRASRAWRRWRAPIPKSGCAR